MKTTSLLLLSLVLLGVTNFSPLALAITTPDPIDCVELYRKSIEENSLIGKAKQVQEAKRMRALIRRAFKMIPLLDDPIDAEKESHADIDSLSPFKRKKVLESQQAEADMIELAQSINKNPEYVAQILRDSTRYGGPALCSPRAVFSKLPTLKDVKTALRNGQLKRHIDQDESYQVVKKWRKQYEPYNGQFLTGMEIEVEFRGIVDAPLLDYVDLNLIYQVWNENYPEEVSAEPPTNKVKLAKELIKFSKYAKKGKIKMEKEGKKVTLRTLPLKFENIPFFFHNVNFFWDDGAIEFNNKSPYKNPADMLESLYILSKGSKFERDIFNPEYQYELSYSRTNFHISSQEDLNQPLDGQFETDFNGTKKDIRWVSHELNKLLGLRMVKRGLENEEAGKSNDFSPFILFKRHDISRFRSGYQNIKGILRISPQQHFNRIEVRRHYAGVQTEMWDYIQLFKMGNEEALKTMIAEEEKLVQTPGVLDHIFYYEPMNLLTYRHVIDSKTLGEYIDLMEYDDEVMARHLLKIDKNQDETALKTLMMMGSIPLTNPHPWYANEPMKVMDPIDAVVELYGKKYIQGYHQRRFCLDGQNHGSACYIPDFDRSKDLMERAVGSLPNDQRHVAK